jgi:hypothetical protein
LVFSWLVRSNFPITMISILWCAELISCADCEFGTEYQSCFVSTHS